MTHACLASHAHCHTGPSAHPLLYTHMKDLQLGAIMQLEATTLQAVAFQLSAVLEHAQQVKHGVCRTGSPPPAHPSCLMATRSLHLLAPAHGETWSFISAHLI